mgnify:CR=1 FL=1
MSLAGQQLVRCPHCISVQPRGPGGELLLDPGENVCANRNCGRTFLGHQAIQEYYPRDGRRLPPAKKRSAPSRPESAAADERVQPALFGGMK